VARWFRLWEKKRGERRTGSPLLGHMGEFAYFGGLFVLGSVALALVLVPQVVEYSPFQRFTGMGFWFVMLVFASFVIIGGAGMAYTLLATGTSAERRAALARQATDFELFREAHAAPRDHTALPSLATLTDSPGVKLAYRLPAANWPTWRLWAAGLFFLAWNSVVAVLAVHLVGDWSWYAAGVTLPMAAIGAWSAYYFVKQVLPAAGVGSTTIEISNHPFYPGEKYEIFLSQVGRIHVNWFEVLLVCDEEATYSQGTDVRVDSRRVYERSVFRRECFEIKPGEPLQQQCSLEIPPRAMHSFQSAHNGVLWRLVVKGDLKGWPEFERSFSIVVYPAARREARS
jgi:hypothetical protein